MDTARELEWYLRDHFFRQANKGKMQFERGGIAGELVGIYLRFRQYDPQQLSESIAPVLDMLVTMNVLKQDGGTVVASKLSRMQCAKCFYVSYFAEGEPKTCQRCLGIDLQEFPKKK